MKVTTSSIATLPTVFGEFNIKVFKEQDNGKEHIAIFTKDIKDIKVPYIRIHSECFTGDTLGSKKCDCADQLHMSLKMIKENSGMILYLRQEGRGIGLLNKINAYVLQEKGLDTIEANHQLGFEEDERNYDIVDIMLKDFSIDKIKLITNNPSKLSIVTKYNIEVVDRVPIVADSNSFNESYLKTKKEHMGHLL